MSHSMPAPPLPPPPMLSKPSTNNRISYETKANPIDECLWALNFPELQKACFLARICSATIPKQCQYRNIESILQQGPTCGLTAVAMLMGGDVETTNKLLKTAQSLNYSNNGEIFSAVHLFNLISAELREQCSAPKISDNENAETESAKEFAIRKTNANNNEQIQCELFEGRLDCAKIRESLLQGCCLFVPYDPDYNHAPTLKYGHKAHWALIIGFLITKEDEWYVLSRHGKSKHIAVWSLRALSDSNANLVEFAQPKGHPDSDFLLPHGGIGGDLGLRERAIIVKGLPHNTTIVY